MALTTQATWAVLAARGAVCWAALFGLYLSCAGNANGHELLVGAVVAVVASVPVWAVAHCGRIRVGVRGRDAIQAWRMPWYMVTGTAEVVAALWQQLLTTRGAASLLATAPFDTGLRVDPDEAGRRALAIFYTTATPNFVVLGLIDQHGTMLYHQVKSGPVLRMTRWLGAGPGPTE